MPIFLPLTMDKYFEGNSSNSAQIFKIQKNIIVVSCTVPVGMYHGCCLRRDRARTSGQDRELGRLHTLVIIPTSSVLEFIVRK
jgi:hypothetical protein